MRLQTNHMFLTTASDVNSIITPLKSLGINFFCWDRNYNDGGRINLCSMPEYLENYYSNKSYIMGNTQAGPTSYKSQILLWSTLPNQRIFEFTKQRGVDNGLLIIESYKDYCEFTAFAVKNDAQESINMFLTNVELLKKFINYFKKSATRIIKQGEKNKIYLPYHTNALPQVCNLNHLPTTLDDTYPTAKLSPRQYTCAKLLLEGKTTKEIAHALSLSSRTIESYIDNLKLKLNCDNKSQLIIKLMKLEKN